jgi:hypothetical protein
MRSIAVTRVDRPRRCVASLWRLPKNKVFFQAHHQREI